MRHALLVIFLVTGVQLFADVALFPSGLVKDYYSPLRPSNLLRQSRARATNEFLRNYFKTGALGFDWREHNVMRSGLLTHQVYQLHFHGVPVADTFLKIHFHSGGWVWAASSNWKSPSVPAKHFTFSRSAQDRVFQFFRADFIRRRNAPFVGEISATPAVWTDSVTGETKYAFEVKLGSFHPFESRRFYVDPQTLRILEEKRVIRHVTQNANVYDINPDATALTSRALTDLNLATTLQNANLHVQRVQNNGLTRDIDPSVDFSADGAFSTDPNSYNTACVGVANTSCPNQALDGVNVYYHVNGWRQQLTTYFTALGVSPTLPDPLDVFVNFPISDGSGGFLSNNAAYSSESCGTGIDRCLLFLYPASDTDSRCGSAAVDFFNLAREANVAVHEYQHYITDKITNLVASSTSSANVGDVLHEGYSDYFGVSHVSTTAGAGAAVVGEYAFQECTYYSRDISTIRPITHSTEEADDPHLGGHSFASGLYSLRQTYGAAIVDKIALQSLFLLPVLPGSVEAVETLVRADQLLNSGAYASAITDVFFNQVKFYPDGASSFRDTSFRVREMGVRSCMAVHENVNASASGLVGIVWLFSVLGAGRWVRRRIV